MILDDVITACEMLALPTGPPRGDGSGGNISISCPLAPQRHGDPFDANMSCSVSYGSGPSLARCFSSNCAFGGSFYWMLKQAAVMRGSPTDFMDFLFRRADGEQFTLMSKLEAAKRSADPTVLRERELLAQAKLDGHAIEDSYLDQFRAPPHPYILGRGITAESCAEWEIGFDTMRQRVTFPLRRASDNAIVGITGRDVTGVSDRKYHNYMGLSRRDYIFGEHKVKPGQPVQIVEGQIDAIRVHQATGVTTVSPLGEGFSDQHVRTLASARPSMFILIPDNDSAGLLQAEKIFVAIRSRAPVRVALPPLSKDPADLTDQQIRTLIGNAVPVLDMIRWEKIRTPIE